MNDKKIQTILSSMPLGKIERLAKDDNPDALFELALRNRKDGDKTNEINNLILAAQLGHSDAAIELSEIYLKSGDEINAEEYLKRAVNNGEETAYFKLSKLIMPKDLNRAISLLLTGASLNQKDCIEELINYYKQEGNEFEANYYKGLL